MYQLSKGYSVASENLFALVMPCSRAETRWTAINHVFQGNLFPRVCAIFELALLLVQSPWHCVNMYLNHLARPCQCAPHFPLHHWTYVIEK